MELLIIFGGGIISGTIDAIAGGGGLIMLPLLLLTGTPINLALGTNKLCGTFGVLTSSLKFAQTKQIAWIPCIYMGFPAVIGALLGSRVAKYLPSTLAEPIILTLLIIITLIVLFKPEFGMKIETAPFETQQLNFYQIAKLGLLGLVLGFHDGFFGPGTGTFLVFVFISICSLDFLRATGSAKVINFLTNLTALLSFISLGNVDYYKGLVGAIGIVIGSYIGAILATRKGAKLIKPLFVMMSFFLIGKLILRTLSGY
jgi:uncharacterized membrane protein YfcA